jgi:hypothetical protein
MSEHIKEETDSESNSEVDKKEETIVQKPKRKLNEKQMETVKKNLAIGREKLKEKKKMEKEEAERRAKEKTEQLVLKSAERIKKQVATKEKKIKEVIGFTEENEDDVEIEEHIKIKPKKKRIIYREESDSEEEVIVKSKQNKIK